MFIKNYTPCRKIFDIIPNSNRYIPFEFIVHPIYFKWCIITTIVKLLNYNY